jgi:hypothetical protein
MNNSRSMLESESGFEVVTRLVETLENDDLHIYSLWIEQANTTGLRTEKQL